MYGLAEIEAMNKDAEKKAKKKGLEPWVITSREQIDSMPPFPFPKLGGHVPSGWRKVNEFFVDSSGWGSGDELALTPEKFKEKLKIGMGYAITEEGQFQVYVGEYKKVK